MVSVCLIVVIIVMCVCVSCGEGMVEVYLIRFNYETILYYWLLS